MKKNITPNNKTIPKPSKAEIKQINRRAEEEEFNDMISRHMPGGCRGRCDN